MDEELTYSIDDDAIDLDDEDVAEANIYIEDIEPIIENEEIVDVVDIELEDTINIDIDESIGWVGGDNTRHYSLYGRDEADQHPITAITGLRDELNDIEALDVVYSDERNHANYYLWEDGNVLQENRVGYFVSASSDINEIKLCTSKNDIFGVTVDDAGFIGGQDDVSRDIKYGLVVTNGVVHVRCELSVKVGDYVICNDFGYAQTSTSGYLVAGRHKINGVEYAEITLVTPIGKICELTDRVEDLEDRMDAAEHNIIAAMNTANEAYKKAEEASNNSKEDSKKVNDVIDKGNKILGDIEDAGVDIAKAKELGEQARALAESALNSADKIRNEAVEAANNALTTANQFKDELNNKANDIEGRLDSAESNLQAAKTSIETTAKELGEKITDAVDDLEALAKDLEPLAVWPEGSDASNATGIAGFVAKANEDSATLASITKFEGEFGKSISGFVQEATKENATVKAIASYQQKDENGNPYGPSGASVLMGLVDANKASIDALASLDGDGFSGLAGLTAQVNKNTSSVTTLASHVVGEFESVDDWVADGKDTNKIYYDKNSRKYHYYNNGWKETDKAYEAGLTGSLAGIQQVADDNKAQLDAMVSYDKDGKSALSGMTAYVDANSASISTLASYSNEDSGNSGIAGLVADVNDTISELSAIASGEFTNDDGEKVMGLAGLNAYVDKNESNVSLLARRVNGKYIVVLKYPVDNEKAIDKLDKNKIYYTPYTYKVGDETKYGSRVWFYENEWTYVNGLTEFTTNYSNYISQDTVYYFGDKMQYYLYYDNDRLKWDWTDDPDNAGLPSAIAGIMVSVDDQSSQINQLVSWSSDTDDSMASISQKADDNGASINLMAASVDKYSVGKYSQAYGLTFNQAKEILKNGTVYIPTSSHTEKYSGSNTTHNFTKTAYYEWNNETWNEHTSAVAVSSTKPSISSTSKYWYIDSNSPPTGYEAFTLYEAVYDENENKKVWKKRSTLSGNASNRIVGMLQVKADNIQAAVTNAQGSVAALDIRVDDTVSSVQTLASQVVGEYITIPTPPNRDQKDWDTTKIYGESVSETTRKYHYYEGGTWKNSSSITGRFDTKQVYYVFCTELYWYYDKDKSVWKSTKKSYEAGLAGTMATIQQSADESGASIKQVVQKVGKNGEVNAASIVAAINADGDSSVYLEGDHIILNGATTNGNGTFSISESGHMTATGGKIGGWNITTDSIGKVVESSDSSSGYYRAFMRSSTSTNAAAFGVYESAKDGAGLANPKFYVTYGGKLYANDASITGSITATSLTLSGDATIPYAKIKNAPKSVADLGFDTSTVVKKSDIIQSTKTDSNGIQYLETSVPSANGTTIKYQTYNAGDYMVFGRSKGTNSAGKDYICISKDGLLTARNALIYGTIYATDGEFAGKITADSGAIAGWDIGTSSISNFFSTKTTTNGTTNTQYYKAFMRTSTSVDSAVFGVYECKSDGSTKEQKFYVTNGGYLFANNAEIEGKITSTRGTIGGWTINNNSLSVIHKIAATPSTSALNITITLDDDGVTTIDNQGGNNWNVAWLWIVNAAMHWQKTHSSESDINVKNSVGFFDKSYETLFDNLQPCRYKYNHGTSDRYHTGFIAQEVVSAIETAGLTTKDFAGVVHLEKPNENGAEWLLRRDEFVSLNTWQIQKAKARITELEERVAQLEALINKE